MTKNHNKGDHIKSEPKEENSLLHALRSARGNRADTEKRLKKELEVLLQEHVDRYLAHLDLPTKITRAVNAGKSIVEIEINDAKTFFRRKLETSPEIFCKVENADLTLEFTKSWIDFYEALLNTVAIEELSKSYLNVETVTSQRNNYRYQWSSKWTTDYKNNSTPYRSEYAAHTGQDVLVQPHRFRRGCCRFAENDRVHKADYLYPDHLRLDWS